MNKTEPLASTEEASIKYVCGIDIASQSCAGCICRPNKSVVVKSITFANTKVGWQVLLEKLTQLDAAPAEILIGMEATSRYGENLYHELEERGYVLCLLHPGQTHQFHQQQGLRAKTDRLDAMTIARVLLSGEARPGYVPGERVATYRELVRLHMQLSDEAARYQNEIQALVVVLFPEFTQVFADPCLSSALAVLKAYPDAQAVVEAGVEPIYQLLRAQTPAHYGRPTAKKLVTLAQQTASSGRALTGRAMSVQILCDQLEHTMVNVAHLEAEIAQLITTDPGARGLQQVLMNDNRSSRYRQLELPVKKENSVSIHQRKSEQLAYMTRHADNSFSLSDQEHAPGFVTRGSCRWRGRKTARTQGGDGGTRLRISID